ncbi:MAG TPA: outer membrane protein assembly factor BamA [Gammaproteobacteria bacterium]|nr:outer membrane protein assembly factor BamA [Gammaproteobacteria bacterium]
MPVIKTKYAVLAAGLLFLSSLVYAGSFVIRDIRVEGLQRVPVGTVFSHIPYEIGDRVSDTAGSEIVRALYKSGLFKDVSLEQDGAVMVVSVIERPAIASINFSGNKDLDTDQLKAGLRDAGFSEGRVFNQQVLDNIKQDLKRSYFDRGKYSVIITSTVSPLERNRVAVDINVREGRTAKIRRVNIVGNKAFDEDDLLDEISLSTGNWISRFTKDDQYSSQKLEADIENLRSFYMDRGYLKFDVLSTQVNISPEKEDVYLTINIAEGDVYTVEDIQLAGKAVVDPEELFPLIELRREEPFSRKQVVKSTEAISATLSDKGYALASVTAIPDIDEENKRVKITLYVEPGRRAYVRRVNIHGNTRSRDRVLRREFRQMEAAWFSAEKVRESKQRLLRLGYFDTVEITTKPVPGSPDQVDVDVTVVEKKSRELMLGVGYSQDSGVSFQARVSDDNFFGTGKNVTLGFNTSDVNTYVELAYRNPYFTIDGISQGFRIMYRETDFAELDTDVARYATDTGIVGLNFGFPITEWDRIGAYLNLEYMKLHFDGDTVPNYISDVYTNGQKINTYKLGVTWSHDTRDKAFFSTEGSLISAGVMLALPGSDYEFWTLKYKHKQYFDITDNLSLSLKGEVSWGDTYGDTEFFPFYEGFYAGGPGSVRGFKSYSIGGGTDIDGNTIPGAFKVIGGGELWFPPPFMDLNESVRLIGFVDFGNVSFDVDDFDSGKFRYSAGLAVSWLSPFGLLNVSYAAPFNEQPFDETEEFQFTFGSNF